MKKMVCALFGALLASSLYVAPLFSQGRDKSFSIEQISATMPIETDIFLYTNFHKLRRFLDTHQLSWEELAHNQFSKSEVQQILDGIGIRFTQMQTLRFFSQSNLTSEAIQQNEMQKMAVLLVVEVESKDSLDTQNLFAKYREMQLYPIESLNKLFHSGSDTAPKKKVGEAKDKPAQISKVFLMRHGSYILIGIKPYIEQWRQNLLRGKKGPISEPLAHALRTTQYNTLYVNIFLSKYIKSLMKEEMKTAENYARNVSYNPFLIALYKTHFIEFGLDLDKYIAFNFAAYAEDKESGRH